MYKIYAALLSVVLLVSACASPGNTIATSQVQTQVFEGSLSTALAGTMTANAPTATSTFTVTPPPTATNTPDPSPTPSGKNEFFDVAVKQVNDNEVDVTFGFQIRKGTTLDGLMIGANPEGCPNSMMKYSFQAYTPSSLSGIVSEQDAIKMQYRQTGKCSATGITLFTFRNGGGNIYSQTFDKMPFTLEMK